MNPSDVADTDTRDRSPNDSGFGLVAELGTVKPDGVVNVLLSQCRDKVQLVVGFQSGFFVVELQGAVISPVMGRTSLVVSSPPAKEKEPGTPDWGSVIVLVISSVTLPRVIVSVTQGWLSGGGAVMVMGVAVTVTGCGAPIEDLAVTFVTDDGLTRVPDISPVPFAVAVAFGKGIASDGASGV